MTYNNGTDVGQLISNFELVFEYEYRCVLKTLNFNISRNVNKYYMYTTVWLK